MTVTDTFLFKSTKVSPQYLVVALVARGGLGDKGYLLAVASGMNHKISIEDIVLGGTVREAAHSTLFAAFVETEKPYPAAIENTSTAAHRITSRPNRAFGFSSLCARPLITRSTNSGETDAGTCRNSSSRPRIC